MILLNFFVIVLDDNGWLMLDVQMQFVKDLQESFFSTIIAIGQSTLITNQQMKQIITTQVSG